jgi:hypothetical protein
MTTRTRTTRTRLDTDPLTSNQLGRIHHEFARLGFGRAADRPERLRLTAELAGSGPIESTNDLSRGEAGRAIGALGRCLTTDDLYPPVTPAPRGLIASILAWIKE